MPAAQALVLAGRRERRRLAGADRDFVLQTTQACYASATCLAHPRRTATPQAGPHAQLRAQGGKRPAAYPRQALGLGPGDPHAAPEGLVARGSRQGPPGRQREGRVRWREQRLGLCRGTGGGASGDERGPREGARRCGACDKRMPWLRCFRGGTGPGMGCVLGGLAQGSFGRGRGAPGASGRAPAAARKRAAHVEAPGWAPQPPGSCPRRPG